METINKKWDAEASKELKKKFKEVKTFSDLNRLRDEYLLRDGIYPKSAQDFFEEFKNQNDIWKHDPSFWANSYWYFHDHLSSFLIEIENSKVYQIIARICFNEFINELSNLKSSLPQMWEKINTPTKDFLISEATLRDMDFKINIDFESSFKKSIKSFIQQQINLLNADFDEEHFPLIKMLSNQKITFSPYLILSLSGELFDKSINKIKETGYLYKLKLIALQVKDIDPKFYDEVEKAINFVNEYVQDKLELIAKFINELLKNFPQNDFNYHFKSLYYLSFMFEEIIDDLRPFHKYKYFNSNLPTVEISYDTPPFFATNPKEWENIEGNINIQGGKRERISEFEPREKNDSNYRKYIDEGLFDVEKLLGVYIARENKIILYERGIQWSAKTLSCDVNALREKVFIHELAHWATHQLPLLHTEIWPLKHYENTERNVHEGLAQLLCYWTIESLPEPYYRQECIDAFKKLNQNQTPPYHVYKQFLNYSKPRIIDSIDRMRDLDRPATLNDWKNIV